MPDEEAIRQIRTILDRWFTEYGIDRTREVLCRVGDEIKLIPEDLLYAEKECPERFRAFLQEKGEAVQGTESPLRRKDIRNAADAGCIISAACSGIGKRWNSGKNTCC